MKIPVLLCVISSLGAAGVLLGADAPKNPGQEARTVNEAIVSRYTDFKPSEATDLIGPFLTKYATSENIPANLLRLAHCHAENKQWDKFDAPLDECIKRFPGSRFWFYAYGLKLWRLKETKENDKYLAAAEAMIKSAGDVPARLIVVKVPAAKDVNDPLFAYTQFWPSDTLRHQWMRTPLAIPHDWAADLVLISDTPERAKRALGLIKPLLDRKPIQIPLDWQYAHVALLRTAGEKEKSQKQLDAYVAALQKEFSDYRAIGLISAVIEHARAAKDDAAVASFIQRIAKDYGNCVSAAEPLHARLTELAKAGRYDEFAPLARQFLAAFPTACAYVAAQQDAEEVQRITTESGTDSSRLYYFSARWENVVLDWITLAIDAASHDNKRPATELLEALDGIAKTRVPCITPKNAATWRFRLNLALGRYGEAVKLGQQLAGDQLWCESSFTELVQGADAVDSPELKALVEQTRKARGVPVADPESPAAALLAKVRDTIKDEQQRMAEEVAGEMWEKHQADAQTITGISELAVYYHQKAQDVPRDKWVGRMMQAYPRHPLTQRAIDRQVDADLGRRDYVRIAALVDAAMTNFPGSGELWQDRRIMAYLGAQDPAGGAAYLRKLWAAQLEAGDTYALARIQGIQGLVLKNLDNKAAGDEWAALAKKVAGTTAEPYCHVQAFHYHFERGYFPPESRAIDFAGALADARAMRNQNIDPEVRWQAQFAEANVLARKGDAAAALKAVSDAWIDGGKHRDLYTRLDLGQLGEALGELPRPDTGAALAKKFHAACASPMDELAILYFQGNLWTAAKRPQQASPFYLSMAYQSLPPATMFPYYIRGFEGIIGTPQLNTEASKFIKAAPNAQDVLPEVIYLWWRCQQPGGRGVPQRMLVDRYPASEARDNMETEIAGGKPQRGRN